MPATSKAQWRWLHTDSAKEALGASGVKEWIGATKSPGSLPDRVAPRPKRYTKPKRAKHYLSKLLSK